MVQGEAAAPPFRKKRLGLRHTAGHMACADTRPGHREKDGGFSSHRARTNGQPSAYSRGLLDELQPGPDVAGLQPLGIGLGRVAEELVDIVFAIGRVTLLTPKGKSRR